MTQRTVAIDERPMAMFLRTSFEEDVELSQHEAPVLVGLPVRYAFLVNGPVSNDTLKHTYDELGRLKKLEIVDDATQTTASYSEEWTFDARSRPTAVQNNLGTTTYAFVGQSGRPSTVNYANGMQTLYDYLGATGDFNLEQIKNLSAGPSPTVISQFDYTYQQDRAIDTWKVDQGSGATTWTFGYDGARQLTSATRRDATQTILESLAYGYDEAGNRTQVGTGTTAPRNFLVNNLNQLHSERDHGRTTFAGSVNEPATVTVDGKPAKVTSTAGGPPFKFEAPVDLAVGANTVVVEARDGNDNIATETYSVTTTGASKNYEHDANGNLRFEKQPNGTVIREYRWDQQNRLARMLSGTHESVYEYDGLSRRTRITEKQNGVQTKQETFIWCGARICQKRSGSTVVRTYFGQGFEQGSADYFYTRDHLGSVRELVASNGTTVGSRLSYDLWGKVTETGSVMSDFTYTGHYYDRATGLSLALYRGYDPNLGRWLSRDPIGLRGGLNLYGYVHNDPMNLMDPFGLSGCVSYSAGERMELFILRNGEDMQNGFITMSVAATAIGYGALWGPVIVARLLAAETAASSTATIAATAAPKLFSSAEREGLKQLFGSQLKGAQEALKAVREGMLGLPDGVTRGTLERYRDQILNKGLQDIPVQQERLRIIEEILRR